MNPKLIKSLKGDQSLYPRLLEEHFPRVFNKMVDLWDTPTVEVYLRDLMMDNKGGSRAGFPPEAAAEILRLLAYLDSLKTQKEEEDVWGAIPEYKRNELTTLGYELNPTGFIKSIEDNNEDAIRLFISSDVDLEGRDERSWTPLMAAAFNGHLRFAEILIKCGALASAKDHAGYTALHWAAYNGHTDVAKLLLEKGADVDIQNQFGWTPLMQAATRGHLGTCMFLITRGADVNLTTIDKWTCLHKAANNGHIEIVKLLLLKGANRQAKYSDGSTPLDLAFKAKHYDIVELLNRKPETPNAVQE